MSTHQCKKLQATLDRFQEAHLWLHMMEDNYHSGDRFRWYLNVFLKAVDEVPSLLKRELQNDADWRVWYKPCADKLVHFLGSKRNYVVHQDMLVPKSKAAIGVTELRGLKAGLGVPISPFEDSGAAMVRYLTTVEEHRDFLGVLTRDEDSIPCIFREWFLTDFDEEVVSLCGTAWLRIGDNITASLKFLGEEVPPFSLACGRHAHNKHKYQYLLFDREVLIVQAAPHGTGRELQTN